MGTGASSEIPKIPSSQIDSSMESQLSTHFNVALFDGWNEAEDEKCGDHHRKLSTELIIRAWQSLSPADMNSVRLVSRSWYELACKNVLYVPQCPVLDLTIASVDEDVTAVNVIKISTRNRRKYEGQISVYQLKRLLDRHIFMVNGIADTVCRLELDSTSNEQVLFCLSRCRHLLPNRLLLSGDISGCSKLTDLVESWRDTLHTIWMQDMKVGHGDYFLNDRILFANLTNAYLRLSRGSFDITRNGLENWMQSQRANRQGGSLSFELRQCVNLSATDIRGIVKTWKTIAEKTLPGASNEHWPTREVRFEFRIVDRLSSNVRHFLCTELEAEIGTWTKGITKLIGTTTIDYDQHQMICRDSLLMRASLGKLKLILSITFLLEPLL